MPWSPKLMSTMQLSFTGDSAGLEVVAVVVAMFVLVYCSSADVVMV